MEQLLFRNHMLAAVCDVHDVLPQRGQLHLHHLWQLLWQHPAPCHRFVWVHWSCLLLWSPKVVIEDSEDTLFHYLKPTIHTNISIVRFSEDIQLMTGTRPGLYLCICWKYISPTIMITILVSFCIKMFIGDLSYEVRSEDWHEVI